MLNAFVQKLKGFAALSETDTQMLMDACVSSRDLLPRYDLLREGDRPISVFVMIEGWACRYKTLPDGRRQITAFLMPGDFCDMHVAMLDEMDHNIATLTKARVATISLDDIETLIEARPELGRAFWRAHLVDQSVLREWIVGMGQRSSLESLSHLLCELCVRSQSIGLGVEGRYALPISQIALADALGLTPVHVNRIINQLRQAGIMESHHRLLIIKDLKELRSVANFDEHYLHRRLKIAA
jgi:CRP-like cAMP-binding protein